MTNESETANSRIGFRQIAAVLVILLLGAVAYGVISENFTDDAEVSSSVIRAYIIDGEYPDPCTINKVDYPIVLGGRDSWELDIEISRDSISCDAADLSIQPEQISGNDAGLIKTNEIAKGEYDPTFGASDDDNLLEATLAPGVYRLMVDGNPTEATITVKRSNTGSAPTKGGDPIPDIPDNPYYSSEDRTPNTVQPPVTYAPPATRPPNTTTTTP